MNTETLILSYLANALWQTPLVLLAGWLAARAVRALGPGAEHRVWVTTLFAQSALPAFCLMPWHSAAAWLRVWFRHGVAASQGIQVTTQLEAVTPGSHLAFPALSLHIVTILYAAVTLYFAARLAWQLARLRTLARDARPIEPEDATAAEWERTMGRFEMNTTALAASSRVAAPVTFGLHKPLLLLPQQLAENMGGAEMETLFAHECAHILRRDFAKNLLYELAMLPVRAHPACWLARARMAETREMVCDAAAAATTGRKTYCHSLLRLAERLAAGGPLQVPQAIGIFDSDGFERRIMKLAEERKTMKAVRRLAVAVTCAALGVGTCALALGLGVQVAAATTESEVKVQVPAEKIIGNLLHKENPVYPPEAKKAHVQGKVVLVAVIGKDGTIEQAHVLSGPKKLQQSALDAVKQWTYKPYLLNGEPVRVETRINIIYTLAK